MTLIMSIQGASVQRPARPAFAPRAPPARAVCRATASQKASGTAPPPPKAANQLEALKQMSKVVADTGDVDAIKRYRPKDCTTNPSLLLKAVDLPAYAPLLKQALSAEEASKRAPPGDKRPQALAADRLAVLIGSELAKEVPGRVSTEVDAHLSYDTAKSVDKALHLVDLYAQQGVKPERLYIKLASTWEGIRACEILQKQGIDCNLTLLFSFAQAAACADAGAALISPFVGRILDWHKKKEGRDFAPHEDPGVRSVKRIYAYYKQHRYKTIVMAASFRNVGEIRELAGCDNITIAPALLEQLEASTDPLPYKLWPDMQGGQEDHVDLSASHKDAFYRLHEQDAMAVEKLKEGIDNFIADQVKLEKLMAER